VVGEEVCVIIQLSQTEEPMRREQFDCRECDSSEELGKRRQAMDVLYEWTDLNETKYKR
jgi:hypothetical protein